MACNSIATHLLGGPLLSGNEVMANSFVLRATFCCSREWCISSSFSGQPWSFGINSSFLTIQRSWTRRRVWRTALALNTGGIPGDGGQDEPSDDSRVLSGTRLGRIVSAGAGQLLGKLNMARKNFPMKIFLLLLGFYTANALATILGQTGDWDVIVAGVVVAAIEGLGMLVYRKPSSLSTERMQSFIVMMNYWKAGVCLGLFVDAFKLGS